MQTFIQHLKRPFAIVAHDAGAANLIFAWLRNWITSGELAKEDIRLVLDGPASRIWADSGITGINTFTELSLALSNAGTVLSGTGWASDLEHEARRFAKINGIYSVSTIDHWVNYPQRFQRDEVTVLPDEIFVADPAAVKLAKDHFSALPVRQLPNLYLMEQVNSIPVAHTLGIRILYLLEPLSGPWVRNPPGEFEVLEYFLGKLDQITADSAAQISLRPHPSDLPGKYDDWITKHQALALSLDHSVSLAEAIGNASIVVGAETFALTIALAAGRKVYSSLPPWAPASRLPLDGIIYLSALGGNVDAVAANFDCKPN